MTQSSVPGEPSTIQGEPSDSAAKPIPTVQESFVGSSHTEGEQPSSYEPEDSSNVEDIPSSSIVDHQQACLRIWMKDHPPFQIIGNPSTGIQIRSSKHLMNHCHYAAFMSSIEPRTMKEALMEPD